jgi:hypothetical protein
MLLCVSIRIPGGKNYSIELQQDAALLEEYQNNIPPFPALYETYLPAPCMLWIKLFMLELTPIMVNTAVTGTTIL